mgnify:CR=1 FL=1
MQRYYRAAKLVRQVNMILLQNLHARLCSGRSSEPVPIDDGRSRRVDELLDIRDEDAVRAPALRDARRVPRAAAASGADGACPRARCARCGASGTAIDVAFRRDPGNRARFIADVPRAARRSRTSCGG